MGLFSSSGNFEKRWNGCWSVVPKTAEAAEGERERGFKALIQFLQSGQTGAAKEQEEEEEDKRETK